MLDFVIFAVTLIVVLISALFYLYPGSRRQTTIDGLDPSDPKEGNLPDITKARSLNNFLIELHRKFGTLASFWLFGPSLAVSVWAKDLIQSLDYLAEKPKEVNLLFEPMVGKNSLLFAKKHELRKQRALWEQMFDPQSVQSQVNVTKEMIEELVNKWSALPEKQHIPIGHFMKAFTLRLSLISGFGQYFRKSNSDLIDFSRSFENCFIELESRASGDLPSNDNPRNERFQQSVDTCRQILKNAIKDLKAKNDRSALFSQYLKDLSLDEEQVIDEAMTYALMYYSLSSALFWTLFYLSSNPEIQVELREKIRLNLGTDSVDKFVSSALSSANVIQWTSRVSPDVDIQVDKHIIPQGTALIFSLTSDHFLDSSCESPLDVFRKHYESTEDNHSLPFGSIGSKRCCPAIKYSKSIVKELITQVIKRFDIELIDSDLIAQQMCGIYSRSEEEIWITLKKI